jgi:hypothetical protein
MFARPRFNPLFAERPATWLWCHLHVILDMFSRCVVGGVAASRESAMDSHPLSLLLADLGVTKSHSRPSVSNDNPHTVLGCAMHSAHVGRRFSGVLWLVRGGSRPLRRTGCFTRSPARATPHVPTCSRRLPRRIRNVLSIIGQSARAACRHVDQSPQTAPVNRLFSVTPTYAACLNR